MNRLQALGLLLGGAMPSAEETRQQEPECAPADTSEIKVPAARPARKVRTSVNTESTSETSATAIVAFNFHGDQLDLVRMPDGAPGVILKRLCEAIPMAAHKQQERLERAAGAGVRWATTTMMGVVANDGKTREMVVLPVRSVPMWAATIDVSRLDERVRDEVRQKLVRYQDEAAEVLAEAVLGPRRSPAAAPAPSTIPSGWAEPRAALASALQNAVASGDVAEAARLTRALSALFVGATRRAPRVKPPQMSLPLAEPQAPTGAEAAPEVHDPVELAERLAALPAKVGMSQRAFSKAAGLAPQHFTTLVVRLRSGRNAVEMSTLRKIAAVANMTLEALLTRTPLPPPPPPRRRAEGDPLEIAKTRILAIVEETTAAGRGVTRSELSERARVQPALRAAAYDQLLAEGKVVEAHDKKLWMVAGAPPAVLAATDAPGMTPAEVRRLVDHLGGFGAAATKLGITRTSLSRYLSGERAVAPGVAEQWRTLHPAQ